MTNTLDKNKTIAYLHNVSRLHLFAMYKDHEENNPCVDCAKHMEHYTKRNFANMLITKIKLGDLDD